MLATGTTGRSNLTAPPTRVQSFGLRCASLSALPCLAYLSHYSPTDSHSCVHAQSQSGPVDDPVTCTWDNTNFFPTSSDLERSVAQMEVRALKGLLCLAASLLSSSHAAPGACALPTPQIQLPGGWHSSWIGGQVRTCQLGACLPAPKRDSIYGLL